MRIKKKHIALLMMVALVCATSICAQKPLTKPEKPQFSSEKKTTITKGANKTIDSKNETIPKYIKARRNVFDKVSSVYNDVGSWETFNERMDDPEMRKHVWEKALQTYSDVGSWEDFNKKTAQPNGQ